MPSRDLWTRAPPAAKSPPGGVSVRRLRRPRRRPLLSQPWPPRQGPQPARPPLLQRCCQHPAPRTPPPQPQQQMPPRRRRLLIRLMVALQSPAAHWSAPGTGPIRRNLSALAARWMGSAFGPPHRPRRRPTARRAGPGCAPPRKSRRVPATLSRVICSTRSCGRLMNVNRGFAPSSVMARAHWRRIA